MLKWKIFTVPYATDTDTFDDAAVQEFLLQSGICVDKIENQFYHINGKAFCAVSVVYSEHSQAQTNTTSQKTNPPQISAKDQGLYNDLRKWRALKAKRENVPAYVYLSNQQLAAVVQARPKNQSKLRKATISFTAFL